MRNTILERQTEVTFPFEWVQLDSEACIDTHGYKVEIYLDKECFNIEDMKSLFYDLFGSIADELLIYNSSWWDFCLDTWNIHEDISCYDTKLLSQETVRYLDMLKDSDIPKGYSGSCKCNNWDIYLTVTLACIVKGIAPYGDLIYDSQKQLFFYFHHTGSIGLYYKKSFPLLLDIMKNEKYDVHIVS